MFLLLLLIAGVAIGLVWGFGLVAGLVIGIALGSMAYSVWFAYQMRQVMPFLVLGEQLMEDVDSMLAETRTPRS